MFHQIILMSSFRYVLLGFERLGRTASTAITKQTSVSHGCKQNNRLETNTTNDWHARSFVSQLMNNKSNLQQKTHRCCFIFHFSPQRQCPISTARGRGENFDKRSQSIMAIEKWIQNVRCRRFLQIRSRFFETGKDFRCCST